MVVQHNMQAMNANRMLNITTGAQSKSTDKLSSGYRINRAADDRVMQKLLFHLFCISFCLCFHAFIP